MCAKAHVTDTGRVSADVAPPFEAQAIARRVAAAHDRCLLTRSDRRLCPESERAKLPRRIERLLHAPRELSLVPCHEGDGHAEHLIRLPLQSAALFQQGEIRDRIRAHGKIDRAHDGHFRIDSQRDMRLLRRLHVEVGAELRQMRRHVGVQALLQDAVRPVRSGRWKPFEALPEDGLDAREIVPHHLLDRRRDALDRKGDFDVLDAIRPRHERHAHARFLAGLYGDGGNGIADEHLVKDLADRRLVRFPALLIRSERLPLDQLRSDGRDALFHARLDGRRQGAVIRRNLSPHRRDRARSEGSAAARPEEDEREKHAERPRTEPSPKHQKEPPTHCPNR